ncbi:hypothetical protein [Bradyrhizobium sp. SZCCHNRI1003]|uniref:hypothetical protein n=1 Tax=Bradyrhizobium sp. SZCCHNRI1003 TaxID=3057275 RepID=UPI0029162AB3|nr:hypothetical protein [Bradyrhizobium sp. SZCCHNRI1003]
MALCWICKTEEGTTGEHLTKRSDIKAVLGGTGPLHLHNRQRRNIKLQSLNARKLKSTAPMCNTCNSWRTQLHDYAWETLSDALRLRRPGLKHGDIVRADRIFPYDTAKQMLNVHLFFVKWLGCQIVESNIPINPPIDTFSKAIMNGTPHQNIWLAFGVSGRDGWVGSSDVGAATFASTPGTYDYLCRIYEVGRLHVRVRFSGVKLKDDWHPRDRNRFIIADLTGEHKN